MSIFNGVVGVHVAIITKNAPKPVKKRSAYIPVARNDDDETASQKSGSTGAGSLAKTEKAEEKVSPPETGYVWLWILLCEQFHRFFNGLTKLLTFTKICLA
jgi:hypothetical protein